MTPQEIEQYILSHRFEAYTPALRVDAMSIEDVRALLAKVVPAVPKCKNPNCVDGMVPTQPDGEPDCCPDCTPQQPAQVCVCIMRGTSFAADTCGLPYRSSDDGPSAPCANPAASGTGLCGHDRACHESSEEAR